MKKPKYVPSKTTSNKSYVHLEVENLVWVTSRPSVRPQVTAGIMWEQSGRNSAWLTCRPTAFCGVVLISFFCGSFQFNYPRSTSLHSGFLKRGKYTVFLLHKHHHAHVILWRVFMPTERPLKYLRLSVRTHVTSREQLNIFPWNYVVVSCTTICRHLEHFPWQPRKVRGHI
jgi:hypothetical protein